MSIRADRSLPWQTVDRGWAKSYIERDHSSSSLLERSSLPGENLLFSIIVTPCQLVMARMSLQHLGEQFSYDYGSYQELKISANCSTGFKCVYDYINTWLHDYVLLQGVLKLHHRQKSHHSKKKYEGLSTFTSYFGVMSITLCTISFSVFQCR